MKIRLFIIFLFFISFPSFSNSQSTIEIKGGLTYMTNKDDYSSHRGFNIGITYYPIKLYKFNIGAGIGYNGKGKMKNYLPYGTFEKPSDSPVEFLELSLPVKTSFELVKGFETYVLLGGRYDVILTTIKRFIGEPITDGYSTFNSTLGITAGLGIQLTKLYPNLILEFSVNPDLTYLLKNKIKNNSIELKVGIGFDGFRSN